MDAEAQCHAIGRAFRAASGKFKRASTEALQDVAPLAPDKVRSGALAKLPSSGGLAALVAKTSVGVEATVTGSGVGVRLVGFNGRLNLDRIDDGSVIHSLYGNPEHLFRQGVTPGWWTESLQELEPEARAKLEEAIAQEVKRMVN